MRKFALSPAFNKMRLRFSTSFPSWINKHHSDEQAKAVRHLLDQHPASALVKHLAASRYWWEHLSNRPSKLRCEYLDPYLMPVHVEPDTEYPEDEVAAVYRDCMFMSVSDANGLAAGHNDRVWGANIVGRNNGAYENRGRGSNQRKEVGV